MAKLYFYYSAMNAGKTTKLLQNNRYGVAKITSRIGLSSEANVFNNNTKLFDEINTVVNNINEKIACILIDEAQFLKKEQIKDLCRIVDELNIPVLTYGLRTDFLGEPFEGSLYLLLWSDELIEVKTICHCGSKATMNAKFNEIGKMINRNNNNSEQIDIGGNEKYISLCRKHYSMGKLK